MIDADAPRPRRWPTIVLAAAGAACVVAGVVLLGAGAGPVDVGVLPGGAATSGPATGADPVLGAGSAPPGTDGSWAPSAGTVPVEVSLPDRGVTAPVVPVGTGPQGAMEIPEPPSTVGWWSPGPLAGSPVGRAVLAGHVDSRTGGLGAFAVRREVGVGEPVEVRGAAGRVLRVVVAARREHGKADLPADLFAPGGPPGLVLITCGGRFDPATGHYEETVVVHAVPAV